MKTRRTTNEKPSGPRPRDGALSTHPKRQTHPSQHARLVLRDYPAPRSSPWLMRHCCTLSAPCSIIAFLCLSLTKQQLISGVTKLALLFPPARGTCFGCSPRDALNAFSRAFWRRNVPTHVILDAIGSWWSFVKKQIRRQARSLPLNHLS